MRRASQEPSSSAARSRERVVACRLGRVRYEPIWQLQRLIQSRLVAAKRSTPPESLPHVLLLLEHNPVFTLGKSGDENNLVWGEAERAAQGVELHRVDRGGDVTFHGPGQLVGYPILDLDRFFTDVHRYLRELEESVILALGDAGLEAGRVPDRTGVWIGPDGDGPERKICAMGVRCSRWVTMHGFALNVNPQFDYYRGIVPCGIDDRGVTSVSRELGAPITMEQATNWVEQRFSERFGCELHTLKAAEAWGFLSSLVRQELDPRDYLI
jgi:lipoyl(octanoyl) transferase